MRSWFLILLAGYAVRSDDNNYYVIDVPPSTDLHEGRKPFKVYWNVPTMQCASKKIPFENLYEKYGIIQNENDRFKGEQVTILYDPGLFPALFKNESGGKLRFRNGGVPQEGDLNKHLEEFKKELDRSIPDENFSGIGIIDFESWRPTFRQNFGVLQPYKEVSIEIERKLHWWWAKQWIEEEAKRRFEESARTFMEGTLSVAKKLRPLARWGFYGFPYCFNMASNNMRETCASNVPQENDEISWLWSDSTGLYPSVYSSAQLSTSQLVSLIRGRVREAARCAKDNEKLILPYFWYRYRDAGFLSETDLAMALSTLYKSRASGILIWGSSNDVNTADKCNALLDYLQTTLGPAIAKYTIPTVTNLMRDSERNETNILLYSTENPTSHITNKIEQGLDLELHWEPPENSTHDIKNDIEEHIRKKFGTNNTNNDTVLQNNSILIDLILNAVLNSESNDSSMTTETPKTKFDKKSDVNESGSSTTDINVATTEIASQSTSDMVTINPLVSDKELQTTQLDIITTEIPILRKETTHRDISVTENSSTSILTTDIIIDKDYDYPIENEDFYSTFITLFNDTESIQDTTITSLDITKSEKKYVTNYNNVNTEVVESTDNNEQLEMYTTESYYKTILFEESSSKIYSDKPYFTTSNPLFSTTGISENDANIISTTEINEVNATAEDNEILTESSTYTNDLKLSSVSNGANFDQDFTTEGTERSMSTEFEVTDDNSVVTTDQVVVY